MHRSAHSFSTLIILLLFLSSCASLNKSPVAKAPWKAQEVAPGIVWKYHHFDDLFEAKQSVTVFDVDLSKVNVAIRYVKSGFIKTSEAASAAGAAAAINGSFFNTKVGGSVVYFSYKGERIKNSSSAPRAYWEAAGFAIDPSGKVSIQQAPREGWDAAPGQSTVLTSGPLLLFEGERIRQAEEKFNTNRHPRTAIGLTKKNHLIAVVVDGRSPEAYGMTIDELATLMESLGCRNAMNLDGGGSSTAWVKGQPSGGVVNYPSDNKRFDHDGERSVANCVLFIPEDE